MMKVRVRKYLSRHNDIRWGIEVKRWWLPMWVEVDYRLNRESAIDKAKEIITPDIEEVK